MEWIICMAAGGCAGVIGSMLGAGSGLVLIPGLALALSTMGVGGADSFKMAVATTHAANIFTGVSIIQAHAARGSIDWSIYAIIAPAIALGSALGAYETGLIDASLVAVVFAGFALLRAWRLMRTPSHAQVLAPLPPAAILSVKGIGIGALAALTGGGGLTAQLLLSHLPERRAIGTAAAIQLAITPPAAAMFALMDSPSQCGANCLGLIYVPAVCAAGVAAVLTAPFGALLAHALPVVAIRRIFACLLVVIAGNLALKSLPDSKRFREQAQAFWTAASQVSGELRVEASQAPVWLQMRR
jgi:uncharacterized membrane protein YfcA